MSNGNPNIESHEVANCTVRVPKAAEGLQFAISYNPATGLPLVGDKIHHKDTDRMFVVTERIWPAAKVKGERVVLVLQEEPRP